MARIHIARSLGSEGFSRLVAAKRLDPELVHDAEFLEMFLDEARVASKIRHRNVVPVLDVVNIEGEVIMVQELVHGAPLHRLFARAQQAQRRIPIAVAVSIAAQTLSGLHAAHEAVDETGTPLGIIHRDVSPQNIMIATDGTARLLDFGVAKTAMAAHVTQTGTFKGKLVYSSPEQLNGNVSRQTDIHALGIVLWELLTGERMHAGRSEHEIYSSIMKGNPPRITEALAKRREAGELDDRTWHQLEALDPVLVKAFAPAGADRFATASDMERALLEAVDPAPFGDVAEWLKSLAQDLLDETDQLIAAEEASWRKANGSGALPAMFGTGSQPNVRNLPRSSTSLDTECAIPSARARADAKSHDVPAPSPPRRRIPSLALALADGIAVVLMVVLLVGHSSPADRIAASPLQLPLQLPFTQPAPPTTRTTGDTHELAPAAKLVEAPASVATPARVKRRPVLRRPATKIRTVSARTIDCSIPFYYEGKKKIFKRSCL
jgi:serine/threonine-protein kinase